MLQAAPLFSEAGRGDCCGVAFVGGWLVGTALNLMVAERRLSLPGLVCPASVSAAA
jgi:hypothetical protein